MEKKYKFTDETMELDGHILHRIQALRDFGDVKTGELGGWIESEANLSHDGTCWVRGDAQVFRSAQVYGDAQVSGSAWVRGDALVFESARVYGDAQVFGSAQVYGNAWVFGSAQVHGDARVSGSARMYGDAQVFESASLYGNAWVYGSASVYGNARIFESARVYESAKVYGSAQIYGNAKLKANAHIQSSSDYLCIGPLGSRDDFTTFYRNADWRIMVTCGCFSGDIDTFEKAVEETHGEDEHGVTYQRTIAYVKEMLCQ